MKKIDRSPTKIKNKDHPIVILKNEFPEYSRF